MLFFAVLLDRVLSPLLVPLLLRYFADGLLKQVSTVSQAT